MKLLGLILLLQVVALMVVARVIFQDPVVAFQKEILGSKFAITMDEWLEQEAAVSWDCIRRNINPPGTIRGFVAASPSKFGPDYFYTWTRDAGLVMRVVVSRYDDGNEEVKRLLHDYVAQEIYHQDGSGYEGSWGRPQNDGPAIRVTTLLLLAKKSSPRYVEGTLRPAILRDLDYIARVWEEPCFDLWEEVCGVHFYTLMVMRRAMVDGAEFAREFGDHKRASHYAQTADSILSRLDTFWSSSSNYLSVTQDHCDNVWKHSGLDTAVILAVNHAGMKPYTAGSDKLLATAHRLESAFENLYPINDLHPADLGTAIGRYPEDSYDGYASGSYGNPWFLTTAAMAELYYRAVHEWEQDKNTLITVNDINSGFFARLFETSEDKVKGLSFRYGTKAFETLVDTMTTRADRFMATVQYHQHDNGSLSEQFNRWTGFEQGARDLTWSYASFISAADARAGQPLP
ncbi:glucoamylase [Lichtheimia corymbifera JMRC:FSU:9682]|uniref:glucan 1,4-alpha-glucosidase n=1 Tax=Lichtheimia corymbifera JMRC:FSU:9682 TaxID=1263082 RepID=A0A068S3V7_9FUNG|nr:glucoamylase [Lichtheimia corymbifera JMRC:FSU:9682]